MRHISHRAKILFVAAFVVLATLAMADDRHLVARAELVDVRYNQSGNPQYLVFEMKNSGDRVVFPLITWLVRDVTSSTVASGLNFKATALLPGKTINQIVPVGMLPTGDYEVQAEVNFQDGHARQTMRRQFHVDPGAPLWSD
jgi:hypothetical protein